MKKISSVLVTVAKEVREGVGEGKERMAKLEGRVERLERGKEGGGGGGEGMGGGGLGGGLGEQENINSIMNTIQALEGQLRSARGGGGGGGGEPVF